MKKFFLGVLICAGHCESYRCYRKGWFGLNSAIQFPLNLCLQHICAARVRVSCFHKHVYLFAFFILELLMNFNFRHLFSSQMDRIRGSQWYYLYLCPHQFMRKIKSINEVIARHLSKNLTSSETSKILPCNSG